jgi:hypothetical protein
MIIKGKSRSGPSALAAHLGNAEKNERVSLLETRGTIAQDLRGALIEMDAYAAGTHCQKPLYHAALSPEPPHRLTEDQRMQAVDALEQKLGLTGHSRLVVMHEKLGREHIHVVWSRIDLQHMKSVSDSHNYRKHEEVSRDLERRFGHDRVQGAHHEREGVDGEKVSRPERTPSRAELRQEERTGIKGKNVGAEVTAIFRASDNALAFQSALRDHGYILAQGDRRDFVIVDRASGIHSLARRIEGMKAAELREFMAPVDREALPTAQQAKEIAAEEQRRRQEARSQAAYSHGEGYVSQTQAALKDHQRRQKELDAQAGKDTAWEKIERGDKSEDEKRIARILDDHGRDRRKADAAAEAGKGRKESPASRFDNIEMTEAQQQRMQRLLGGEEGERDNDLKPDRQHEVPGGGRTRSR